MTELHELVVENNISILFRPHLGYADTLGSGGGGFAGTYAVTVGHYFCQEYDAENLILRKTERTSNYEMRSEM